MKSLLSPIFLIDKSGKSLYLTQLSGKRTVNLLKLQSKTKKIFFPALTLFLRKSKRC